MDTRRATEGTAGVLVQYVEEPEGAQRRWHARIRRRSRKLVRNAGTIHERCQPCIVPSRQKQVKGKLPVQVSIG
jgi:hypothetical protein